MNRNILISSSSLIVIVVAIVVALYFTTNVFGNNPPAEDCEMSEFSKCDSKTGLKSRTIIKDAKHGGKKCGELQEKCPVDCVMSEYGKCDHTTGLQKRTVLTPALNEGKACGELERKCPVDCQVSEFGKCDVKSKTMSRDVMVKPLNDGKLCPVDMSKPCESIPWKCVEVGKEGDFLALRTDKGNVECLTTSGKGCVWGHKTKEACEENMKNNLDAGHSGYKCPETAYSVEGNWCNVGFNKLYN